MLRSIGADHVIDYTQEDFTKNGETYDVIFDVMGKSSFSGSVRSLNKMDAILLGNRRTDTNGSRAMDFDEKQQESNHWGSSPKD